MSGRRSRTRTWLPARSGRGPFLQSWSLNFLVTYSIWTKARAIEGILKRIMVEEREARELYSEETFIILQWLACSPYSLLVKMVMDFDFLRCSLV